MKSPPLHLRQTNFKLGTAWMLLSLGGFAFNSLVIARVSLVHGHTSPWAAMFLRGLVGLLTVQALAPGMLRLQWKRLFTERLLAERGLIGTLGIASFYATLGALGAGKATLINNSWSVFAAVMAAIFLGERLGLVRFLGLCVALSGLALLLGVGWDILGTVHAFEWLAVVGAVLSAWAVVAIRQLSATHSSALIYASQCIYCLLVALPFAGTDLAAMSGAQWGWICGAAVAVSLAQLAMTEGFRYLTVSAGGAFQMGLPLVISSLSVVLFGETFSHSQIWGAFLIIGGSLVTVLRRR